MIRRVLLGCATIALVAGACAAIPARAADSKRPPDLTGQWKLDAKRSDNPAGMGMRGPRGGRGGEAGGSGWGRGRRGGMGGGPEGGGTPEGGPPEGGPEGARQGAGNRPVRLPDLLHVTATPEVVSFEDSSGAVVEEIVTTAGEDTLTHAPGAQVMKGAWKDDKLVVEREGRRGGRLTTTIGLEGKSGELLVIKTRMESMGDMPAREFKRVYERVKD